MRSDIGDILFQYDIETGRAKRVTVGSTGGHVSRNFLSDVRGYAYVPRVTSTAAGKNSVAWSNTIQISTKSERLLSSITG